MTFLYMHLKEQPFSGDSSSRTHKFLLRCEDETDESVFDWLRTDRGPGPGDGVFCERPANGALEDTGLPILGIYDDRLLQDISFDIKKDSDPQLYEVTAKYDFTTVEGGGGIAGEEATGSASFELSFEFAPEAIVYKKSISTISNYPADPFIDFSPDIYGAINIQEDGTVAGESIPDAAQRFTLSFTEADTFWTSSKLAQISRNRGKVNSTVFNLGGLSYAAGEVRFLGASGTINSTGNSTLQFNFGIQENRTDITLEGITGTIVKDGWDLLQIYWAKSVDATTNLAVPKPLGAYVERVLYRVDLNAMFT